MKNIKILGIAGSIRKNSYNKALLGAAISLAPGGVTIETADIADLPLFDQDLETTMPAAVNAFKEKVEKADAILFVTPEYNYSVPGALKNAIDWASRPYGRNSFEDKPVAVMGASGSMLGTARAQYHLRQTFVFLNMHALNKPEVMVASAHEKFDADGNLTDETTKQKVRELLEAFAAWTRRLRTE